MYIKQKLPSSYKPERWITDELCLFRDLGVSFDDTENEILLLNKYKECNENKIRSHKNVWRLQTYIEIIFIR